MKDKIINTLLILLVSVGVLAVSIGIGYLIRPYVYSAIFEGVSKPEPIKGILGTIQCFFIGFIGTMAALCVILLVPTVSRVWSGSIIAIRSALSSETQQKELKGEKNNKDEGLPEGEDY